MLLGALAFASCDDDEESKKEEAYQNNQPKTVSTAELEQTPSFVKEMYAGENIYIWFKDGEFVTIDRNQPVYDRVHTYKCAIDGYVLTGIEYWEGKPIDTVRCNIFRRVEDITLINTWDDGIKDGNLSKSITGTYKKSTQKMN